MERRGVLSKSWPLLFRVKNNQMGCCIHLKAAYFSPISMGFGQLCAFHFGKDVRALDLPVICRHPSMILCSVTNLELSVIYQISPRQSQQSGIQTKQRPFQTFLKINCFSNFSCNPTHIFAASIPIGRIHSMMRSFSANVTDVVKPLEIIANLVKLKKKKHERIHGTVRNLHTALQMWPVWSNIWKHCKSCEA